MPRSLLLVFVAFHPSRQEVETLRTCLLALPPNIGYAIVVNDYHRGEPVELLEDQADHWLLNSDNPGYGRAVNRLMDSLGFLPKYLAVLNTDLSWRAGTFTALLSWLQSHPEVVLAVPQIIDDHGVIQKLCKRHPTVLGLLSRRFIPQWLKPSWLQHYDRWYVMSDKNYHQPFDVPYLSGCCMLIKGEAYGLAGGFDNRYFLYLEDADLTRAMSRFGRCIHLPCAEVVHTWGRGNYTSLRLVLVNIHSAWIYFRKWGLALW